MFNLLKYRVIDAAFLTTNCQDTLNFIIEKALL